MPLLVRSAMRTLLLPSVFSLEEVIRFAHCSELENSSSSLFPSSTRSGREGARGWASACGSRGWSTSASEASTADHLERDEADTADDLERDAEEIPLSPQSLSREHADTMHSADSTSTFAFRGVDGVPLFFPLYNSAGAYFEHGSEFDEPGMSLSRGGTPASRAPGRKKHRRRPYRGGRQVRERREREAAKSCTEGEAAEERRERKHQDESEVLSARQAAAGTNYHLQDRRARYLQDLAQLTTTTGLHYSFPDGPTALYHAVNQYHLGEEKRLLQILRKEPARPGTASQLGRLLAVYRKVESAPQMKQFSTQMKMKGNKGNKEVKANEIPDAQAILRRFLRANGLWMEDGERVRAFFAESGGLLGELGLGEGGVGRAAARVSAWADAFDGWWPVELREQKSALVRALIGPDCANMNEHDLARHLLQLVDTLARKWGKLRQTTILAGKGNAMDYNNHLDLVLDCVGWFESSATVALALRKKVFGSGSVKTGEQEHGHM